MREHALDGARDGLSVGAFVLLKVVKRAAKSSLPRKIEKDYQERRGAPHVRRTCVPRHQPPKRTLKVQASVNVWIA
jgi:hypothetical protein